MPPLKPPPSPDGPRVKLTLGRCLFAGMFDCPCVAGSIVASLRDLCPDSQCADCGHTVSLHQEFDEPPPTTRRALPYTKLERGDLLLFSTTPEHSFEYKTDPMSSPVRPPQQQLLSVAAGSSNNHELPRQPESFHTERSHRDGLRQSLDRFVGHTERGSNRTGDLLQTISDPLPLAPGLQPEPDEFSHETAANNDHPYICPRTETVSIIAGIVHTRGAVLIWGLPGSGKSTLGQLLFEYLREQETKTVFIKDWQVTKNGKPEESLAEFCQPNYPGTSSEDVINGKFVFIIGEAHKCLQKLKRLIKNAITNSDKGPKFCLLSDQGQFADKNSVFEMLPEISYLSTHGACADNVGIFFSRPEFEDVVSEITSKSLGYKLSQEAANHVFTLTAGHPAIVRSILCYIDMHHAGALLTPRRRLKRLVSLEGVVAVLHDDCRLFQYLGDKVYPGTFARQNNIAIKVFQKLLAAPQGRITWKDEYRTTGKCFENGLVCHEVDLDGADIFKFPSPLHERWARWYHMIQPQVYEGELTPVFG
ncbi:Protein kinase rad3 [Talaromyces islandicus]|uniref:Protein kinase rad3 n=1 Tax=Talaromyces islandicus TaxID=28573 RepID=A0A0U1LY50_TALIS|nr:Protein kinase rad3 [Talaromyces islandicus]